MRRSGFSGSRDSASKDDLDAGEVEIAFRSRLSLQVFFLLSIELIDHTALFNIPEKAHIDKIGRFEALSFRIALAIEQRQETFVTGKGQDLDEIDLFMVKKTCLFNAQSSHVFL